MNKQAVETSMKRVDRLLRLLALVTFSYYPLNSQSFSWDILKISCFSAKLTPQLLISSILIHSLRFLKFTTVSSWKTVKQLLDFNKYLTFCLQLPLLDPKGHREFLSSSSLCLLVSIFLSPHLLLLSFSTCFSLSSPSKFPSHELVRCSE